VVDDLEAAVEHLVSKFSAGPFFVLRDVAFEHLTAHGEPATFAHDRGDIDSTLHDAAATLGHHVELHADCQQLRDVFGMVRDASVGWDGSDPLRPVA
jgi:hypothetical protein